MQIQEIAESFSDTSHRVRLACQDLQIPINEVDSISEVDWQEQQAAIHAHVLAADEAHKESR